MLKAKSGFSKLRLLGGMEIKGYDKYRFYCTSFEPFCVKIDLGLKSSAEIEKGQPRSLGLLEE